MLLVGSHVRFQAKDALTFLCDDRGGHSPPFCSFLILQSLGSRCKAKATTVLPIPIRASSDDYSLFTCPRRSILTGYSMPTAN